MLHQPSWPLSLSFYSSPQSNIAWQALLNPPGPVLNSSQVSSVSKYSTCAQLNFTETILKQLHTDLTLARCFDSFIRKDPEDVCDTMLMILDFRGDEKVRRLKIHDDLPHAVMQARDTSVRHKRIRTVGVLLTTCARNYSGNNAHLLIILPSLCALTMWGFQAAATSLTGLELQLLWQKKKKKTTKHKG